MIKAVDAYKKSLKSKQTNAKKGFKDLVETIEEAIEVEMVGGGEDSIEIEVDRCDQRVVNLVAEHVRTLGFKTALIIEKETTRTIGGDGKTYKAEENTFLTLRISAAHLEGKVFLDETPAKKNSKKEINP